jgi:hypothetical protein
MTVDEMETTYKFVSKKKKAPVLFYERVLQKITDTQLANKFKRDLLWK